MADSANVLKFAEARASEIASMMDDVNCLNNKTAFQRMPPHMRRRAASHNPKRVPRKLREAYLIQNPHASSKPKKASRKVKKKMQKKKHDKHAKNYPEEYASRSKPGSVWLGTHIWHAKRCKMENIWGYKLPIYCNDKKLGATHQAATKHAMLQDLSYYCCIAIEGSEEELLKHLTTLIDPNTGCHFGSAMFLDGTKEGKTFLYHPNKFPQQAIGPVTFIWKPLLKDSMDCEEQEEADASRTLWIWCHPSFHNELVEVLTEIFQLKEVNRDAEGDSEASAENQEPAFASKVNFVKVRQHFQNNVCYTNSSNIHMCLLKDKLVRHRIIGPNAQSVLTNVIALADIENEPENEKDLQKKVAQETNSTAENDVNKPKSEEQKLVSNCVEISKTKKRKLDAIIASDNLDNRNPEVIINGIAESAMTDGVKSSKGIDESVPKRIKLDNPSRDFQPWWKAYYKAKNRKTLHNQKKRLLECLRNGRSNYYIPPGTVIGFTVRDPRLILSRDKQRFSSIKDNSVMEKSLEELLTIKAAECPIWLENIRNEVTATQISEDEINKERAKYVIPSESMNLGDKESRVPIMLIHQPGRNGFAYGWDLIAPLGWSMAFWIPLVLNGGRVTGLRDLHFVNLETGQPNFPLSYPDTKAGVTSEETQRTEDLEKYYRRPPAKRPNFKTFGVFNPFFMPWNTLIEDWLKEDKSFLSPENVSCEDFSSGDSGFFVYRQKEVRQLQNLCDRLSRLPKANRANHIEACKKSFRDFVSSSLMCQGQLARALVLLRVRCVTRGCPTAHSGIFALSDCDIQEISKNPNYLGPVEHNHNKRKGSNSPQKSTENESTSTDSQSESNKLERPQIESLQNCSRKMIGYLSEGGFSSIMGKGCGIGHCSLLGLLYSIFNCINAGIRPLVLIREQHSFQYRVSLLEIIPNYL